MDITVNKVGNKIYKKGQVKSIETPTDMSLWVDGQRVLTVYEGEVKADPCYYGGYLRAIKEVSDGADLINQYFATPRV